MANPPVGGQPQFVGGIQRIYAGDISPDDEYFVVGSGSGGDRPPINDTAVACPLDGNDFVEPLWVSRAFDSVYSIAISEVGDIPRRPLLLDRVAHGA